MEKIKTVYDKSLVVHGEVTVTLNEEERRIICNALVMVAPNESNIIPLMLIADKIIAGKDKNE